MLADQEWEGGLGPRRRTLCTVMRSRKWAGRWKCKMLTGGQLGIWYLWASFLICEARWHQLSSDQTCLIGIELPSKKQKYLYSLTPTESMRKSIALKMLLWLHGWIHKVQSARIIFRLLQSPRQLNKSYVWINPNPILCPDCTQRFSGHLKIIKNKTMWSSSHCMYYSDLLLSQMTGRSILPCTVVLPPTVTAVPKRACMSLHENVKDWTWNLC